MPEQITLYLRHKYLKIKRKDIEITLPIEAVALIVDMFDTSKITRKQIDDYLYCETEYNIHYEIQNLNMDNQLPAIEQKIIRKPKQ